jgi:hypothetical protein
MATEESLNEAELIHKNKKGSAQRVKEARIVKIQRKDSHKSKEKHSVAEKSTMQTV